MEVDLGFGFTWACGVSKRERRKNEMAEEEATEPTLSWSGAFGTDGPEGEVRGHSEKRECWFFFGGGEGMHIEKYTWERQGREKTNVAV